MRAFFLRFTCLMVVCPLMFLSACGGDEENEPRDANLYLSMRAGEQSMVVHRYEQAQTQYEKAFIAALTRNDREAIINTAYNIGVTALASGKPKEALHRIEQVRKELEIRQITHIPAFDLIEAASYYRLHQWDRASFFAHKIKEDSNPDIAERARFIWGLTGYEMHNSAQLVQAWKEIGGESADRHELPKAQQADIFELEGCILYTEQKYIDALAAIGKAIALYRDVMDYRGMSRATAQKGDIYKGAGQYDHAADLYLQAAQSFEIQKDHTEADLWLQKALGLPVSTSWKNFAKKNMASLHDRIKDAPAEVETIRARASQKQKNW